LVADVAQLLGGLSIKVDDIKRIVTESSEATRHASTITGPELDALEAALSTCFVPVNQETTDVDVRTAISDPTEFEWEANKHEAQHRQQYMDVLQQQVRSPL
jgi:hypothetical protein